MKTPRIFIVLISFSMFLILLSVIGTFNIFKNLSGYISGIELFVAHCFALDLLPLTILPIFRFSLPFIVGVILILGFIRAVYKSFHRIKRNNQILRNFSKISFEESPKLKKIINEFKLVARVYFFKSDNLLYAFNSGILQPKIYLSTGLVTNLSSEELKAVILHEKYHIEHRDIPKLFFILFIEDWLFFLPVYRWLSRAYRELIEKISDDKVVSLLGDSLNFAKTLLKVVKLNRTELPVGIGLSIVDHYPVETRIKRLINKEENISVPSKRTIYWSSLIALLLFVPFFFRTFLTSEKMFHKFNNFIYNVCGEHDEKHGEHHKQTDIDDHHLDVFFDE